MKYQIKNGVIGSENISKAVGEIRSGEVCLVGRHILIHPQTRERSGVAFYLLLQKGDNRDYKLKVLFYDWCHQDSLGTYLGMPFRILKASNSLSLSAEYSDVGDPIIRVKGTDWYTPWVKSMGLPGFDRQHKGRYNLKYVPEFLLTGIDNIRRELLDASNGGLWRIIRDSSQDTLISDLSKLKQKDR